MNYYTNIVNFYGALIGGGALISKILLFGGALFREGRLSECERSLDHLWHSKLGKA